MDNQQGDEVSSTSPDDGEEEKAEIESCEDEEENEKSDSRIRYSKEFIMNLKNAPLSKQRPAVLIDKSLSCIKWVEKKRSETSLEDEKNGIPTDKRRPGDPRERLRKESEGIVLSPQRRSFNSGCHIASGNGVAAPGNREILDNPIFLQGPDPVNAKSEGARGLRAGSGRIAPREGSIWERSGDGDTDNYIYRPPGATREREDRYERRPFGRDMYSNDKNRRMDRDSESDRFNDRKDSYRDDKRNNRYDNRRRASEKEEPEWFSSGPTSQHDTIELRGFDDPIPTPPPTSKGSAVENGNNTNNASSTTTNTTANNSSETNTNVKSRPNRRAAGSGRTPSAVAASQAKEQLPITDAIDENDDAAESDVKDNEKKQESSAPDLLEAFFKMESIPGFQMNGDIEESNREGSRFSQWFKRESPPNTLSQDGNVKDALFPNMLKDPAISVFTSESHVFAPISPAENTNFNTHTPAPNPLLEMLKNNQHDRQFQHSKVSENIPGKMHSLEELEARMRSMPPPAQHHQQAQMVRQLGGNPHHSYQSPPDEEVSNFQRLMVQASGGFPMQQSNSKQHMQSQPLSILQMLNKSQKVDHSGGAHVMESMQNQVPVSHDLLCKLLQVQQNQDKMSHHSGRHFQVSPIPNDAQGFVNNLQPSRDLLQRPEAQAIIQGLGQGEITIQNLMQQLNNPGLQNRHRELIGSIVKYAQQQAPSPRNRLILPPQQQLRVSPLPPNAYCVSPIMATSPNTLAVHHPAIPQRIPSPRELQVHTQSIMQTALIKKKLEEQRENYRRRQEQTIPQTQAAIPRSSTPSSNSPNKNNALGFTPTSVLRKMTADKDCDPTITSGAKAAGWGAPPSHMLQATGPKQGRPIVKASSNNSSSGLPYQQAQNEFPQQYQNQLFGQQGQPQGRPIRPAGASSNSNNTGNQQHGGNLIMQLQQRQQPQHQQMFHPSQLQGQQQSQISGNGANPFQMFLQQKNEHGRSMAPALSPTSNQLARWFSPELLAQANAGKLPSVNMAQNVLSLEELERIQHNEAIVHN